MLRILGPRVLVDIEKADNKKGGLFIPDNLVEHAYSTDTAKVIAVGTGYFQAGKRITPEVAVGDRVVFPKMVPKVEYDYKGKKYFIIADSEFCGVITPEDEAV